MVPSGLQAPPLGEAVFVITTGGRRAISIRLSWRPAKKPMERLSGDQNGNCAPPVPVISRAAEWSGLTQSFVAPPDVSAIAMLCPSGEMTLPAPMPAAKSDSAGGLI